MKTSSVLTAALLLAPCAIAHAQTSDSASSVASFDSAPFNAATPAVSAPTVSPPAFANFAPVKGATGGAALALPDVATLQSGAGLNLTNGRKDPSWAKFASGTGSLLFLGAGTLLPLVEDGKDGTQHSIRTADALITSVLFSEGLKRVTHKKRPDGGNYESFPSGHVTAAFAVATMQAHYHPKQAIFWYAGATAIAASRVTLRRHYTVDVIAGALLGFATARLELGQNRGLLFRPFIRQTAPDNRVTGMSFSKTF